MHSWVDKNDASKYYSAFKEIITDNSPHSSTFESKREKILQAVNHFLAMIEKALEIDFIFTNEEMATIIEQLGIFKMEDIFFEKNRTLFDQIIMKINNYLIKYEIEISKDNIDRIQELIFNNAQISDEEKHKYCGMCNFTGSYVDSYRYCQFLLITDILEKVNQKNLRKTEVSTLDEKLASQMVNSMANGILDVEGNPIYDNNERDNYSGKNLGYSGMQLLGLIASISSIILAIFGIGLIVLTR